MAKAVRGSFTRDSQGRVTSVKYDARYGAQLPGKARINEIIRQAQRQGATRAGVNADVSSFQGYEMGRGEKRLVRAFRKGDTPAALRGRLSGNRQPSTRAAVLSELRSSTGAEKISGLQGFQLNFYYGK